MIKPELQYSILCDDVRQERNGKFMFLGAFNMVHAKQFPFIYPSFHVANNWCSGQGEFKEQSRIVDEENKIIVASPETSFKLKDFSSGHFVISRFANINFPHAGKYSIEVILNGELFRRFPFGVLKAREA